MTNLQQITEKLNKANPKRLELKFGCETQTENNGTPPTITEVLWLLNEKGKTDYQGCSYRLNVSGSLVENLDGTRNDWRDVCHFDLSAGNGQGLLRDQSEKTLAQINEIL